MRQPGIEPGPHRWQRRILTVELLARTLHIYNKIYILSHRPDSNQRPRDVRERSYYSPPLVQLSYGEASTRIARQCQRNTNR